MTYLFPLTFSLPLYSPMKLSSQIHVFCPSHHCYGGITDVAPCPDFLSPFFPLSISSNAPLSAKNLQNISCLIRDKLLGGQKSSN